MYGTLKIITTPIGNIYDISIRAIQEFKKCNIILVENIKHSKKLLHILNINYNKKIFISYTQNINNNKLYKIMMLLKNNNIILSCNAGSPNISDPGGNIINTAIKYNYNIQLIPGPSALTSAIMGSGFNMSNFIFLGFLPRKGLKRKQIIINSLNLSMSIIIFESPKRIINTLLDLKTWCGYKKIIIARELTKQHETFHRGYLGQNLIPQVIAKGEIVIIVENTKYNTNKQCNYHIYTKIIKLIKHTNKKPKIIAKYLNLKYSINIKEAYTLIYNIKNNIDAI